MAADLEIIRQEGPLPLAPFEERLEQIKPLLPLSGTAIDVLQYLNGSHRCEANILANLIARDTRFTEQLLRIVNSSIYHRASGPVTQLTDAISTLGIKRIGELALGVSSFDQPPTPALPWFDATLAGQRSLAAALAANQILQWHKPTAESHSVMFGAMMYPLARLVTGTAYPGIYETLLTESYRTQQPLLSLEQELFPHTPASALARLLTRWGIPVDQCAPLCYADTPFSQLTKLNPALQTAVQILKTAILLGELAVGKWMPWDEISFPTNMQFREVGAGAPQEIVELVRAQLHADTPLKRHERGASLQVNPAAMAEPPRVLSYCNLALEVGELLPGLLKSMNFEIRHITNDQQCAKADALINCLHTPISWLAAKAQGATCHNWVILTTEQYPASWNWMGQFVQTPASYQAIRNTCERLVPAKTSPGTTLTPGTTASTTPRGTPNASKTEQPHPGETAAYLSGTPTQARPHETGYPHAEPKPREPDAYEPLNADA